MFDVFIKFSEYSLFVRSIVVGWIVFTAAIAIVALFAKPIKTHAEESKSIAKPTQEIQQTEIKPPAETVRKRPQSTGIYIRNSENIKVHGNTVNGADEGYVSEGSKNVEFKDNKYTPPKK